MAITALIAGAFGAIMVGYLAVPAIMSTPYEINQDYYMRSAGDPSVFAREFEDLLIQEDKSLLTTNIFEVDGKPAVNVQYFTDKNAILGATRVLYFMRLRIAGATVFALLYVFCFLVVPFLWIMDILDQPRSER